jgi:NAD+ synthase
VSRPILHITLAQINPTVGALQDNLKLILKTWDAVPANTDLVVFPELVVTGYPPEDLVLKPSFIDAVEDIVEQVIAASKTRNAAIVLTAPWRKEGRVYNAAHLIQGGKIIGSVCKYNLPNYGVFDERRIFASGPLPSAIEFKGHTLGIMICEDMWFPDSAAALKKAGAEMLIVPNGSPFHIGKKNERHAHAAARIKETELPLLYINQVGGQDDLVFDGGSFAMNEKATIIAQGPYFEEDLHHTLWDKNDNGHWRCVSDHSVTHMEEPEEIYRACMLALRDYVTKNGFPGVLIGMSGGIDSALSAVLAVDALGAEMVRCVMMPSPFTSKESLKDAEECSDSLDVHYEVRSIEPAMKAFEATIPGLSGLAHENMQSRARGLILMSMSNAMGHMVLTTGNKSEMAVGYATLYGDMCGGYNALKDLYKIQVYELATWRNANKPQGSFGPEGMVIPERIITKAPTAELRHGQLDQDSLPPYEILDGILEGLIEHDLSVSEIVARGYERDTVLKIWKLLDRAEYKRRQSAPGVKVNARAFGRDRRYPITNLFNITIEKA